jgi:hypothetical protein
LGVHNGRGSGSLSVGGSGGLVFGVDPVFVVGLKSVMLECGNFNFIQDSSTSVNAVDVISKVGVPIDIIHFDTEHNYGQVINEFGAYKHLFREDTVLLFDDVHAADDSVLKAIYTLPLRWFKQVDDLHGVCGYGVGIM